MRQMVSPGCGPTRPTPGPSPPLPSHGLQRSYTSPLAQCFYSRIAASLMLSLYSLDPPALSSCSLWFSSGASMPLAAVRKSARAVAPWLSAMRCDWRSTAPAQVSYYPLPATGAAIALSAVDCPVSLPASPARIVWAPGWVGKALVCFPLPNLAAMALAFSSGSARGLRPPSLGSRSPEKSRSGHGIGCLVSIMAPMVVDSSRRGARKPYRCLFSLIRVSLFSMPA